MMVISSLPLLFSIPLSSKIIPGSLLKVALSVIECAALITTESGINTISGS
jgi:hypothetical protein